MFCPNCKSELIKNPKHAQGVFQCNSCSGVYYILATTSPSVEVATEQDVAAEYPSPTRYEEMRQRADAQRERVEKKLGIR